MRYWVAFVVCAICLLSLNVAQAQNHVGIILSGHDYDCSIVHQGVSYPCKERLRLYVGDEVHKKPSVKMLKIKWAPYFNGEIKNDVSMVVVAVPAEKMKGNMPASGIKQYISDFVKPVSYGAVPLVTRSGKKATLSLPWIIPVRATLITDYPLKLSGISGDNEVKSIAVLDKKGEKVFEKTIPDGKPALIVAEQSGIRPLQPYTVYIATKKGIAQKMAVVIMDEATRAEVMKGIADIGGENSSASETLLRKIAYLQLISDAYPEKMDLYWLGHQLLLEYPQRFTKEEEGIARQFVQRYQQHNQ
jgi:hypothetical protein